MATAPLPPWTGPGIPQIRTIDEYRARLGCPADTPAPVDFARWRLVPMLLPAGADMRVASDARAIRVHIGEQENRCVGQPAPSSFLLAIRAPSDGRPVLVDRCQMRCDMPPGFVAP